MKSKKNILAVLPLRSGSKRVKDKNIRIVGCHPLYYHSIATCLKVKDIDVIVVSVDCQKYKEHVENYFKGNKKVKVIIRPAELATDDSKSEDVILHAIKSQELDGSYFQFTMLVQATTPLTRSSDIQGAIKEIQKHEGLNSIFSASQSKRFYLDDSDVLINRPMTQNKAPKIYENGCFWIFNTKKFQLNRNRIIEPFKYYLVDEYDSLDIDTYSDMAVVDLILSKRVRCEEEGYFKKRHTNFNSEIDNYYDDNTDPDGNIRNLLNEKQGRIDFAKDEINYINNLFKNGEKACLLSIGCGSGYAESIISSNITVYGIEPDIKAYKNAEKTIDNSIHGNFNKNFYKENFFDVVFCHHVIEHVPDPIKFMKDIHFVLKPGGVLIIGTPNFDGAMAKRYGDNYRMLHDKTHTSLFSDLSMKEFLVDFGFMVKKIEYPYFDTKFFNKVEILKLFEDIEVSPPFYGNIFTVYAEKK